MSLRSPPRDKRASCASESEGAISTAFLPSGRTVYVNHRARSTSWIPPRSEWNCRLCLPYGWEEAVDAFGNLYYVNHLDRVCTYDDPRQCCCSDHENGSCGSIGSATRIEAPPQRSYKIVRHPEIGFGFVAASQRPVLIQFVTPGGPSDGKLLTNDQILSVNGIDARCLQKEEVVTLVRETLIELHITVTQPTGKQRNLRRRHCRVRFCDQVVISNNDEVESMPILPNVLRVFLENGQTKSFKYDEQTSVQDVVNSLVEKLNLRCPNRFALALEQSIGSRSARLTLLLPHRKLAELVEASSMPYAKCRFRLSFMPANMQEFFTDDPNAFRYLYDQCVNDVVAGRFATEMRYEACVRLAALHMRQVAVDTGALVADGYTSLTRAEREYGLATFVPMILLENVKSKELRKHLRFYLKKDDAQLGSMSGIKSGSVKSCTSLRKESVNDEALEASISGVGDPADEIRLRYVQIVSHLPTFGGRCFSVTFKKTHVDMVVQADMRNGLLVRHPGRINDQNISIDYKLVDELRIIHETDILRSVTVRLRNTAQQGLEFLLDKEDIDDFIMYITGYCKVLLEKDVEVTFDRSESSNELLHAPSFSAQHFVHCAGWNFALKVPIECAVAVDYSEPLSYEEALSMSGSNSQSIVPSLREPGKSNGIAVSEKARNSIVQANGATSTNVIVNARHRSPRKSWIPELFTAGGFPGRRHGSPRPRDSIRIHKQRHSIPTGTLLTVLEAPERRFSTATGATQSARLTPTDVARRRLTLAPHMDLWNPGIDDIVLLSGQATPSATDKPPSVMEIASGGACLHNGGKHADDDDLVKSTASIRI